MRDYMEDYIDPKRLCNIIDRCYMDKTDIQWSAVRNDELLLHVDCRRAGWISISFGPLNLKTFELGPMRVIDISETSELYCRHSRTKSKAEIMKYLEKRGIEDHIFNLGNFIPNFKHLLLSQVYRFHSLYEKYVQTIREAEPFKLTAYLPQITKKNYEDELHSTFWFGEEDMSDFLLVKLKFANKLLSISIINFIDGQEVDSEDTKMCNTVSAMSDNLEEALFNIRPSVKNEKVLQTIDLLLKNCIDLSGGEYV